MQYTVGKLMECIVARKLARDLEDSDILLANRGGWGGGEFRQGNMYEGFQRKEAAVAVAIGLADAYNRVQFKLLMDLLIQYGVSLTLTRWVVGALLERTVAMQLENWRSAPDQLTMGLPQGSLILPVLFNVYTKGLANLNQNGPSKILTVADDGLIYKT